MDNVQQILGILSSILGLIVTIGAIICTTIPNIRKKIIESFLQDQKVDNIEKELKEVKEILKSQQLEKEELRTELELSREADICLVRDRITHIYFKNLKTKTIKAYELENLTKLYSLYNKLGGNSYVQQIYTTITTDWEVVQ